MHVLGGVVRPLTSHRYSLGALLDPTLLLEPQVRWPDQPFTILGCFSKCILFWEWWSCPHHFQARLLSWAVCWAVSEDKPEVSAGPEYSSSVGW